MKSNTIPSIIPKTISSFFSPCAILNTIHKNTEKIGIITNDKYFKIIFMARCKMNLQ